MKKFLLVGVSMIAFGAMRPPPAKAILGVGDICANCAEEITQLAMWAKQANDMLMQLNQLRQQYQLLTSTYNAIAHATDVAGVASALGGVTRTYMPEALGTLEMIGTGARFFGRAGNIRSFDQLVNAIPSTAATANNVARITAEWERQQITTANAKAFAEQGLLDMEGRIAELTAAQIRIAAAVDGTEVGAVHALITTNQTNLQIHQASIANLQLALQAADRTDAARMEQLQIVNAQEWAEATQWAVDAPWGE